MVGNEIDFGCIAQIVKSPRNPTKKPLLDLEPEERFSDAVVVPEAGATEGTFFVEEVVRDLTPSCRDGQIGWHGPRLRDNLAVLAAS